MYKAKLHAGEVEVMILAQQKPKADLISRIEDNGFYIDEQLRDYAIKQAGE